MLKQHENKAKVPDSVTVGGQVFHRHDFEDPAHPGFSVPGRLFTSTELQACGLFGLVSPSGFAFHAHLPLPLAADPTRVSASEAPEGLRRAVAEAEKRLKEAEAKVSAALDARTVAEEEQQRAARRADKSAYNQAVADAAVAEERRKDLELAIPSIRVQLSHANEKLRWWLDDERLHRSGAVSRPEPSAGIF